MSVNTLTPSPPAPATAIPSSAPTSSPTLSSQEFINLLSPHWRVASYYNDIGKSRLCVSNGDGSQENCLTTPEFLGSLNADWSPAGDRLVIASDHKIVIWTIGGNIEPILTSNDTWYSNPDWSPDGNWIAFASDEVKYRVSENWYAYSIFVRNLGDSTHRNVTAGLPDYSCDNPDWSPDGKWLLFSASMLVPSSIPSSPGNKAFTSDDIFLVHADYFENPLNLTASPDVAESQPHWSPDGHKIAFISSRDGSIRLWIMDSDGSGARPVSSMGIPSPIYAFYWLPDGKAIMLNDLVVSIETGDYEYIGSQFAVFPNPVWLLAPETISLAPIPTPHCAYGWTRLYPGAYTMVSHTPVDLPNRVRSGPDITAEIIYQAYPETRLKVLEGPVCADGLIFWKVESTSIPGGSGWTAEGDGREYWLEPYKP